MAYKVIIFDLGKVIFDVSFDLCFQSWSESSGVPSETIKARFDFDDNYNLFEKHAMSADTFRRNMSERLGIHVDDEAFDKGWCSLYQDPYPGIKAFLLDLKKHYGIVALTNTNPIHETVWPGLYKDVLEPFEHIFISSRMGVRKPEAECYQMVLDNLGINAKEALFLDDNTDNIRGAEAVGIECILVQSPEQMKRDLCLRLEKNG